MICKVLCVYRDVSGKQCAVDFDLDGQFGSLAMPLFLDKCKSCDFVKENFKIIPYGVSGKGSRLKFKQYTLWSDLVKNHPGKWVVMEKVLYDDSPEGIYGGIVVKILRDSEINKYMKSAYKKNLNYERFRTTYLEGFVGGALYL